MRVENKSQLQRLPVVAKQVKESKPLQKRKPRKSAAVSKSISDVRIIVV